MTTRRSKSSRSSIETSLHGDAQRFRDRPRAAAADESNTYARPDQQNVVAHPPLTQRDGRALHLFRLGDDSKDIVHARWLQIIEHHGAHDESESRRLFRRRLEQRAMIGADQTQIVGAAAFHV